jgi:hypothetical protein
MGIAVEALLQVPDRETDQGQYASRACQGVHMRDVQVTIPPAIVALATTLRDAFGQGTKLLHVRAWNEAGEVTVDIYHERWDFLEQSK